MRKTLNLAEEMETSVYHIPALLDECVEGLGIKPGGVYVDATFGGGGHSRAIIARLGMEGRLYSFDQDIDAYANRIDDRRFTFVHGNFAFLRNFLRFHGVEKVDGIIADLGVSFHHFDARERGFSFRLDGRLDMRMNRDSGRDAAWIVANYTEEQLADTLYLYGELRNSRKLAHAIVAERMRREITTTSDLVRVITPFIKPSAEKKELAQVFQALRIEVNDEISALKKLLQGSLSVLKPGGRLVVLTYHSLEDRLVKNFIKSGNVEGRVEKDFFGRVSSPLLAVNNKVIVASDAEVERNPRARSAKLRIAERVADSR